jgi:CRP-like cAMP-binding protein
MQNVGVPLIQAVNTLARSPLFLGLDDDDIARLNARCLWRRVRAGEFLLDEPADGYALSVVTNGRVRAVRIINGREIILGDIDEGEYFWELTAIDGKPGRRKSSQSQTRWWRECPRMRSERRFISMLASAIMFWRTSQSDSEL